MRIITNIINLFFLLMTSIPVCADEKEAKISVAIIQHDDSLKFCAITKEPQHHLSFLMQGLQVHLVCGNDSIYMRFPDATMVKHKVKRHPNEVKPTFDGDSIGKEVRPDIIPLIHVLSDTLTYISTCKKKEYTSNYIISLNKEDNSLTFEVCMTDMAFSGDTVLVNILSLPQRENKREFTGRKLSKENKANPHGLGEAPVPGRENSRTIDIKMTKKLERVCIKSGL